MIYDRTAIKQLEWSFPRRDWMKARTAFEGNWTKRLEEAYQVELERMSQWI
jgi:hypothetical protein